MEVIGFLIIGALAFGGGLLVGRRNPKIADTAASLANTAKDAAKSATTKATS